MASALDSASGSVLSSEALSAYAQSSHNCQNYRGTKQAWAESKVKAVVSKRAYASAADFTKLDATA